MKKWFIIFCCAIGVFFYANGEYNAQMIRKDVIREDMDAKKTMIDYAIDDKELEVAAIHLDNYCKDFPKFSDASNKAKHYYKLKIYMESLICLLIFIGALCLWNKWRNENPNNPPKLFWTLILGWIYLLYYLCDKNKI